MTRQAMGSTTKSGSHIAESVLRSHSPVNTHFDAPAILAWSSSPRASQWGSTCSSRSVEGLSPCLAYVEADLQLIMAR